MDCRVMVHWRGTQPLKTAHAASPTSNLGVVVGEHCAAVQQHFCGQVHVVPHVLPLRMPIARRAALPSRPLATAAHCNTGQDLLYAALFSPCFSI
jgi:hypothetical protein